MSPELSPASVDPDPARAQTCACQLGPTICEDAVTYRVVV